MKIKLSHVLLNASICLFSTAAMAQPAADFTLSASQLIREFDENKLAASMKYNGKRLVIKGVLDDISPEKRYGKPDTVELKLKPDGQRSLEAVRAYLIPQADQIAAAIKLKKGDFASVTCTGEIKAGILGVEASDCRLETGNDAMAQPAMKVEALALAMSFRTAERDKIVAQYMGKKVSTSIFIENFREIETGRRMIDANSGFFCDVARADLATFPSRKGSYQVQGVFVVVDDKPGLSRCTLAQ